MTNVMAYATAYTRIGKLNMLNRKPYRTASQKALARQTAYKCEDGTWRSNAPVSFHRAPNTRREA